MFPLGPCFTSKTLRRNFLCFGEVHLNEVCKHYHLGNKCQLFKYFRLIILVWRWLSTQSFVTFSSGFLRCFKQLWIWLEFYARCSALRSINFNCQNRQQGSFYVKTILITAFPLVFIYQSRYAFDTSVRKRSE